MSTPVKLHVYDLSNGLARQLAPAFLGKQIDGIWHTGVVVYGTEYFFGGGIAWGEPGETPYGIPVDVVDLGTTSVSQDTFHDFLRGISPRFTAATYNILTHNCNNFSNEVVKFLTGGTIPDYIVNLPSEVMDTPMGAMLRPMLEQMQAQAGQMAHTTGFESAHLTLPHAQAPAAPQHPHDVLPLSVLRYRQPVLFTQANVAAICKKLREFLAADAVAYDATVLEALEKLLANPSPLAVVPAGSYELLDRLVTTVEPAHLFPVLDLWRLLVLHPAANARYVAQPAPLTALLKRAAANELPAPALLITLRVGANLAATEAGAKALASPAMRPLAVEAAICGLTDAPAARMTAATLLYNIAVNLTAADRQGADDITSALVALVHAANVHAADDLETAFRLLMALGQLLLYNDLAVELVKGLELDLKKFEAAGDKVREIARELSLILGGGGTSV